MIISRTPFRMSFFGGGTDYPAWYNDNGGAVLATTINKYCYISCRYLPPFFEHKYRIVYSKVETVKDKGEIQHPVVRAAIEFMDIDRGLEIHHDGDLPARTGLGSSSSFTVGMLHALYALKGIMPTKKRLALEAIHLERNLLKENVGSQDQILAAIGGFNRVDFDPGNENAYRETPILIDAKRIQELQSHMMLFFTGISRYASNVAKKKIDNIPNNGKQLTTMYQMVEEGVSILTSGGCITDFGKLLHESWMLKRELSDGISSQYIDEIYTAAKGEGAIGGKLLGAGGGGFMLVFAPPQQHSAIEHKLRDLLRVPFEFESQGSQIVMFQPDMADLA
ncbi:MAG: kinase [Nitrospinaceae bacterium]|jgi:D-glycero-alpha-D-manno-heptose-7-phosphate kinase|nr:kinase [Nitrospina sp.]MBT5376023.1 kinase [Nitrospinaceae bacterium]MBT5868397.1 kinase [Nitrospinaceae bacterium]MBT6346297.1 kinase [Nitrospina sp.]